MEYISTRGGCSTATFSQVLLAGLAPDGGLYVPKEYPQFTESDLRQMSGWSYNKIVLQVLKMFVGDDIPEFVLERLVNEAYTASNFGSLDITPIQPLTDRIGIQKLSNGPTLAFKDIGMLLMIGLMDHVLELLDRELNILGATSGDTGSAAERAVLKAKRLRAFMLSPFGRMAQFQRKQMYTIDDPRVFNLVADGTFHDHQRAVKLVNGDAEFKEHYSIGAVNSMNWARIVAQVAYHVYGYTRMMQDPSEIMTVSVPSGNFGDALAAYVAGRMGLRMNIIVATNVNDVLDQCFRTGVYRERESSEVKETDSCSMDIGGASNFERLIFDLLGRDHDELNRLWESIRTTQQFDLGRPIDSVIGVRFASGSATDEEGSDTIRMIHERYGILIDSHTAVALKIGFDLYAGNGFGPMLIMETAQPTKFEEVIQRATGLKLDVHSRFRKMYELPEKFIRVNESEPAAIAEEVKKIISQSLN